MAFDHVSLLVEKLKLMEARRNYFGNIFWRMPGLTIGVLVVFIGLLSRQDAIIHWGFFLAAGIAMFLLSGVAERLKQAQDEAEAVIDEIDRRIRKVLGDNPAGVDFVSLPKGKPKGARHTIVMGFRLSGWSFLVIAAWFAKEELSGIWSALGASLRGAS